MSCSRGLIPCLLHAVSVNKLILNPRLILQGGDYFTLTFTLTDNRSIFDELIPFIKSKKKDRQIIVVTHNANIVLGSDAEEVIIANQHGKNSPNKEYRFEYRSGSIEDDKPIMGADGSPESGILNSRGVQQHVCDILEGGKKAFDLRKQKYRI